MSYMGRHDFKTLQAGDECVMACKCGTTMSIKRVSIERIIEEVEDEMLEEELEEVRRETK